MSAQSRLLIDASLPQSSIALRAHRIHLLGSCPDVSVCRRKVLADWLARSWSADAIHLTRSDNRTSGGQQTLF